MGVLVVCSALIVASFGVGLVAEHLGWFEDYSNGLRHERSIYDEMKKEEE